jgi:sec-independent protein translocase protein TatB
MFGMGGSEIIVILIVALLFLGPDKLPDAAKQISKGIRDIKKQSRVLQQSIEDDEHIGGAIRDIKSALRGEDEPPKPLKPRKPIKRELPAAGDPPPDNTILPPAEPPAEPDVADDAESGPAIAAVTLPMSAGEADPEIATEDPVAADAELAAMIRPASGTVAKGAAAEPDVAPKPADEPERKHG